MRKTIVVISLSLGLAIPVRGQKLCVGVMSQLRNAGLSAPVYVANDPKVTAFTDGKSIFMGRPFLHAIHPSDGECAFIIAHEMGHIATGCMAHKAAANPRAGGGATLGARLGATLGTRHCEEVADEFGMKLITAAGFKPMEAAGFLGKLQMFMDIADPNNTNLVHRYLDDHPVSEDRIKHLSTLLQFSQPPK